MRVGLLSDVHGNLAALRAVAAALDGEPPLDQVIVAGDLLWGGARPRQVWDLFVARGWTLVRGNADENIVAPTVDRDFPVGSRYRAAAVRLHAWLRTQLDSSYLEALAGLPLQHRLATPAGDLLVVHASPRSTTDQCGAQHNSAAEVEAAYGGTGAAAIAFGHWHSSFVRTTAFALLINVASVSLPIDGRPLAAYTVLTATPQGWIVEQRRVPYDPAEEQRASRDRGQPRWHAADPPGGVVRGVPGTG